MDMQEIAKIQAMYNQWVQSVLINVSGTGGAATATLPPCSGSPAAAQAEHLAPSLYQQLARASELLAKGPAAGPPPPASAPSSQPPWVKGEALVAELMGIIGARPKPAAAPAPAPVVPSPRRSSADLAATLSAMQRVQRDHVAGKVRQWGGQQGRAFTPPSPAHAPSTRTVTTGGNFAFWNPTQQGGQPATQSSGPLARAMALPVGGAAGSGAAPTPGAALTSASLSAAAAMLRDTAVMATLPGAVDSLSPEAAALLLGLLSASGAAGVAATGGALPGATGA